MNLASSAFVVWAGGAPRVVVPLGVFRFPLPGMLASLVIDGLDQTIFQTFTSLDVGGYQPYDTAHDVCYLSLASLSTRPDWGSRDAFDISRFLFYYRLVRVVIFERTQIRP